LANVVGAPSSSIALLVEREGFDAEQYFRHFGPYHWTYLAGYRELLHLFALAEDFTPEEAAEFVKGLHLRAVRDVPNSWKAPFNKASAWDACHPGHVGIACQGGPLRFDRACQALKALEFALRYSTRLAATSVYDCVSLHPAMYVVRGLNDLAKGTLMKAGPHQDELITRLYGRKADEPMQAAAVKFLLEVMKGDAVTYRNAEVICSHLHEREPKFAKGVTVGTLLNRGDDERNRKRKEKMKKECNPAERPFIAPSDESLRRLAQQRAALEKSA
jgi:hypothetical protein